LNTISLFEYKRVPKDRLTHREVEALLRSEPPLIEVKYATGEIIPQNRVGVVKVSERNIEILPKIYKEQDIEQNRELVAKNLLKMLDYSEYFDVSELGSADLSTIKDFNILEIIIYIFAKRLQETLQDQPYREYKVVEQVLGSIKGRIDFGHYTNPATMHRIPCIYNGRTVDNTLNRTLRYVCHLLSGTVSQDFTFSRLRNIVEELDGVTLAPVDIQQIEGITFSRLNEQYKPFIELSKLFLDHSGVSPQQSNFETFTFVIPMESLFQKFVASLLSKEKWILPGAKVMSQQSIGHLASTSAGGNYFEMIPDIRVDIDGKRFIVDTKYKEIETAIDIQSSDVYQMYAYASQYGADGILLLYPNFGAGRKEDALRFDLTAPPGYKQSTIPMFAGKVRFDYDLLAEWETFVQEFSDLIRKTLV
jgi:5-methylcytosine-specific restriction enzyme subunit McrC